MDKLPAMQTFAHAAHCFAIAIACTACSDDAQVDPDTHPDTVADTGSDTHTVTDTSDASDTSGGTCPPSPGGAEPRFEPSDGRFTVSVFDGFYAQLMGAVRDGPNPSVFVEAAQRGACRKLTYTPSSCTPACGPDAVCVAGACQAYPTQVSVGTLTLTGVRPDAITVAPDVTEGYFWDAEGTFAPDAITLSADGGTLGAFTLTACTPLPMAPDGDWAAVLEARPDGADATLRWTNPVAGARVYLRMTTGIGTHGGISPVELECEGPDVGALTLPGDFLDALYAQGWSCGECGDNRLVRYHASEVTRGATTIELRAAGNWLVLAS